jgi:hypothetical protein
MDHFVPFKYFEKNEIAYCPKCACPMERPNQIVRKVCSGGFLKSCPMEEHFHRKCSKCGGKWLEATFEADSAESATTLKHVLASLLRRSPDLSEEKLLTLWREAQIREVNDS